MAEEGNNGKRDVFYEGFGRERQAVSIGRYWFLGIGINRYLHFSPLYNAVKDVQDIAALLQQRYGLKASNTRILLDEEATRDNIIARLDELVDQAGPTEKVLIYYSGHGHLHPKTGKGYWIPYNAEKHHTAQYIRNSTILGYIEDINALHTLLISDSCFSGSLFVRGGIRSTTALEELEAIPSRWALCSGRHDEAVYDGEPGQNSPFAASIAEVLRTNRQPALNVVKLIDRVVEQTRANYEQLPEGNPLFGVGHKGGQYVFRLASEVELQPIQVEQKGRRPSKARAGLFTDSRDGQQYRTIEFNGLIWFADNLNFGSEKSWFYDGQSDNGHRFGRLYSWEETLKACPPGWRIPTDEEWKALARNFGGYFDWGTGKEEGQPEKAFGQLLKGGSSGFDALMGGYRLAEGVYYSLGNVGSYWSSTEENASQAWNYTFDQPSGKIYRFSNPKSHGRSCRCVREVVGPED
ncbi:MAG: caspase family protein [Phaeodactylibacter sp.]|nr:caspase family protein [Phaeodactylibacter sp.]MCB0615302.1 caspase family protein [Phaeodactylibacter sp.]